MERSICLKFPFKINNMVQEEEIKTQIERKENAISFSLPFRINLSASHATLKSLEKYEDNYIYVFIFKDLNTAKTFVESPVFNAQYDSQKTVEELEKEADDFMIEYENIEKRAQKKIKVYDEDGFYEYK